MFRTLILLGLISASINLLAQVSNKFDQEHKQARRFDDFWKSRNSYLNGDIDLSDIYNKLLLKNRLSKQMHLLSDNIWKEIGPQYFDNETNLNNGYGRINCLRFNPLDSNELWAGSAGGGLWIYSIKDSIWTNRSETNFLSLGISDIAFSPSNPNIVYLATGDARGGNFFRGYSLGILRSSDNGKTFTNIDEFSKFNMKFIKTIKVSPENPDLILFGTNDGLYSFDNKTKTKVKLIDKNYISDIEFHTNKANIIYVSTANPNNNYVFKSLDSGKSFLKVMEINNSSRVELSVLENYPSLLYVLSDKTRGQERASLSLSENEGETFKNLIANEYSRYLISSQGFYNMLLSVDPNNRDIIFVGGIPLHITTNGGKSFNLISNNIHVDQHDLIFDSGNNKIYLANDGGVYVSNNLGSNWTNISKGLGVTQFYKTAFNPHNPDLIFGGSQDNGLIRFKGMGINHLISGDAMDCAFAKDKPNFMVSVLQAGQIYLSDNSGTNFSGINISDNINEERPWNTPVLLTESGDSLFIAFKNIWLTIDKGATWSQITDFNSVQDTTFISDFKFNKTDGSYIFSKGNVLFELNKEHKTNLIKNFNNFITSIELLDGNIYLTFGGFQSGFKIEKMNSKVDFVNLSSNLPNVPVNNLVIDKVHNMFYIATDAGVYRKHIDSLNWEDFNNGLSYPIVNEIELDSSNGKLYAATFGRGLWTYDIGNCSNNKFELNYNDDIQICEGDSLLLSIKNPIEGIEYLWSNGKKGTSVKIDKPDLIFAYYQMDQCSFYSNIINISFFKKYGIKLRSIGRNPACINDPVIIEAITEPRDSCSIYWSNGAIGDTTFFNMEGTYYAYSLSKNGCIDTSMSFDVAFNPLPQKPIFEFKNYLLQIKNYFQGNLYLWYHNDSLINPILTDRHYPMYGGNYYLKLIDTNYCTSFSDTITVSSEQLIFNPVLYPNPSDNFINISYYTTDKSQIKIAIYSYLGLMAGEYEFNTFTGLNANTIDVSSLSQGIYFLEINFNRQKKVIKFVKILSKIE